MNATHRIVSFSPTPIGSSGTAGDNRWYALVPVGAQIRASYPWHDAARNAIRNADGIMLDCDFGSDAIRAARAAASKRGIAVFADEHGHPCQV